MVTVKNPILTGFYPDPSICRVGEDFYLVTSSFAYAPGVPLFHSRDLAHWEQIGNILQRKEQLAVGGEEISRGIYAPSTRRDRGQIPVIWEKKQPGLIPACFLMRMAGAIIAEPDRIPME